MIQKTHILKATTKPPASSLQPPAGAKRPVIKKLLIAITTVLLLVILSIPVTTSAQVGSREAFIDQIPNPGIEHNEAVRKFSRKFATGLFLPHLPQGFDFAGTQSGNRSLAFLQGDDNVSLLTQLGYDNTGIVNIFGNDNQSDITQDGTGLLTVLNMQGSNNALDFNQSGNNLGALFNFDGDDMNYRATQSPDARPGRYNIELTPGPGTTAPPINITTTRRHLPVIIRTR